MCERFSYIPCNRILICPPLKRCKSRELRGGVLMTTCDCVKRNGLQYDCPRSLCQANKCFLELKQTTPLVCPLLGIDLRKNEATTTTTTTTVSPPTSTGSVAEQTTKASNPNSNADQKEVEQGGIGVAGIFLILTSMLGLGLVIFLVIRNPARRQRILSFFRRGSLSVHYSRVQGDADTNMLTVIGADESDDDLII